MTYPILITVRDRNQAYHCRHDGIAASSTSNPGAAAQRLADKLFGEGTHRVRMVRDCRAGEPGEWAIETATLPEHMYSASVRITLADDGHYYLDVRKRRASAYRAHSRHGSLDAAIDRARAVMATETAA
jgi:hypothetical protein